MIGYLIWLALLCLCCWLALRKDDRDSRQAAWKRDHDRRAWAQGQDGQAWNWSALRRRHLESPGMTAARLRNKA